MNTIEPRILLTAFGDSSVDFEVSLWINNAWDAPTLRSSLHQEIWWALKDVGVVIAFPQLDVHFDPEVYRALEERKSL